MPLLKRLRDFTNNIKIGSEVFEIETVKGKKQVVLPWEKLKKATEHLTPQTAAMHKGLRGVITLNGRYSLLAGEKLSLIFAIAASLEIEGAINRNWRKMKNLSSSENLDELLDVLPLLVKPALRKKDGKSSKNKSQEKKELGFISLFTDGEGDYWVKCSRGFHTSLNKSLASVETLIGDLGDDVDIEKKHIVNQTYRRLSDYFN